MCIRDKKNSSEHQISSFFKRKILGYRACQPENGGTMYVGSELEVSSFYIIEHFYLWCIPLLHHYLTDIVVIITLDTCRYLRMQSGQSSLSTIFFYCPRTIPCIFRAIFHFSVTFLDIHRLQVIEHFLPTYYY